MSKTFTKCVRCENDILKSAIRCNYCGAIQPKVYVNAIALVLIIALLAFVLLRGE